MRIKKCISVMLAVLTMVCVFTVLPPSAQAAVAQTAYIGSEKEDFSAVTEDGTYKYVLCEDGTAEITGFKWRDKDLTIPSPDGGYNNLKIPSKLDGHTVSRIGDQAFFEERSVVNVVIPDTVTTICDKAFYDCNRMQSVVIPDSVTEIGDMAFSYCSSLYDITFSDSVIRIGSSVFYDTSWERCHQDGPMYAGSVFYSYKGDQPEQYTVEDGTLCIAPNAFFSGYVKEVVLPDSIQCIGESAFGGCRNLYKINIPDSVKVIEARAFEYAQSIREFKIPDGVREIGERTFYNCSNLLSVTLNDSIISIGDSAFLHCGNISEIIIPPSVTFIGASAFEACHALRDIEIPDSLVKIGKDAFADTLWASMQPDGFVFAGKVLCQYKGDVPDHVDVPHGTLGLAGGLFEGCRSLKSISIPDTVLCIGESAFANSCIDHISLGSSVKELANKSFSMCYYLQDIEIPRSVEKIGERAFEKCSSMESVTMHVNPALTIGTNAFTRLENHMQAVYIDDLDAWCRVRFEGFDSNPLCYAHQLYLNGRLVTELTIPTNIQHLGPSTFKGCESIKKVTIPDTVTCIDSEVFNSCKNLTSVTIPDSVAYIGYYAFLKCTSLTRVTIPDSVSEISDYAFASCKSLQKIKLPTKLKEVSPGMFMNCTSLLSVDMPDSAEVIGSNAFYGCTALKNIRIPESVKMIDKEAYGECSQLESLTLPDGITMIGEGMFEYCGGLRSVTIPASVKTIDPFGFYNCTNLNDIYYTGSEEEWQQINIRFDNDVLTDATIHYNCRKDVDTGVLVSDLDEETEVTVRSVPETSLSGLLGLSENEVFSKAFDITLFKDSSAVQPDGAKTVRIPATSEDAKVYRLENDNTMTDMHSVYENGFAVFTTDHFSVYIMTAPPKQRILLGDIDGDGDVTVADATVIQRYVIKTDTIAFDEIVADVDGDGILTIVDATFIQRYSTNVKVPYAIGEEIK